MSSNSNKETPTGFAEAYKEHGAKWVAFLLVSPVYFAFRWLLLIIVGLGLSAKYLLDKTEL